MKILDIKHLSVYFKNSGQADFCAVNDVSLSLEQGKILGIVGESGSGKSVTALSILGLLPYPKAYHSENSSVIFDNKELIGLPDKDFQQIRGNKISFVFQEPMSSLNPLHKIGAQIAESLQLHQNLSKQEIKAKTLELLNLVKIPEPEQKLKAYPFELSGGQRQRVMIAMAIANNPQILIADEPTTALDVTIQEQIIDLLLELKHKLNMSIIFISHNLRLVHKISDYIAVMYHGNLVEYGTAKQVFEVPEHSYTKKLISSDLLLNLQQKNDNKTIMSVQNIEVAFPRKKNIWGRVIADFKAVNDVSFELKQSETLGIVGESGSGKTSLALAVINLLKHKGNIVLIDGKDSYNLQKFSKDLQIVFQDPYNSLNPRMTVQEIIGEGLSVHFPKLAKPEKINKIKEILNEVNLTEDILNKYPHEFSGGQRQRIALARALVLKPKIIILDEPTSALDVTVQAQIVELLKTLQSKYKISYMFISHDMNAIRAMSHRVMVMQNGKVVEQGTAEQIFKHPQQPYTKQLIKASLL
ncbi:MAG: dipeptide ABC transporter ATP-binding protein [Alphaproteobacteria bacterium]|nr:dipeptide ABC transporter ATP-binding protein [Alphaproteobacteria bacterium]